MMNNSDDCDVDYGDDDDIDYDNGMMNDYDDEHDNDNDEHDDDDILNMIKLYYLIIILCHIKNKYKSLLTSSYPSSLLYIN